MDSSCLTSMSSRVTKLLQAEVVTSNAGKSVGMSAQAMLEACSIYTVHPFKSGEQSPWEAVNTTLLADDPKVQLKGLRIMYLELLKGHLNVLSFARESVNPTQHPAAATATEPGSVIRRLVQLLARPVQDPNITFAEDIAAAYPDNPEEATSTEARTVMQTQLVGILLSIILQLSLADDSDLRHQLHEAGAELLLCKMAIGKTDHIHPDLEPQAKVISDARPDIHTKMIQLYRLIPLAVSCICQATGSWDDFTEDLKQMSDKLTIFRQGRLRGLAARLQDELTFLQHMKAGAAIQAPQNAALQPSTIQDLANTVTTSGAQHLSGLQLAYKSAISGYNQQQAGNCLYWLFKEPQEFAAVPNDTPVASGADFKQERADQSQASKTDAAG